MLTRVAAKRAAEICEHYGPSNDAQKLLHEDLTPAQFVERLFEAGQYRDVIDFLARALPKQEAIWWACMSVRHAMGPNLPPDEFAILKTAVEWVLKPEEANRRAAQVAGKAAGFGTPAGLVALAVMCAGGSLTDANFPVVPPKPYMTPQSVAGSIVLASAKNNRENMPEVQRELAELGIAIAEGKVPLPSAIADHPSTSTFRNRP